uniref:Uncharacterized protein n=1 Tax=Avena sativa TaxID=4498 RepID=A0ACD5VGZ6_AVESA
MASRTLARAARGLPPLSPLALKTIGITDAGRSGQAERALKLFDAMPSKNQVAWNAALAALMEAGRTEWALSFFQKMPKKNATSYTTMIGGLSRARAATRARHLFDELPLDGHNVFTWTAMMSCHVRNGEPDRALELFVVLYGELFARKVLPNAHSFSSLLKACVALRFLPVASQLHPIMVKLLDKGSEDCIFAWNALIDVHAKLGALSDAEKVFHGMRYKNISSWNIMMNGYSRHKLGDRALDLSKLMTGKDGFSWNIILSCLRDNCRGEDALRLFIHLVRLEGHRDGNDNGNGKPCVSTYTTVLHICSVLALLVFGRQVHARTVKNSLCHTSAFLCNSLVSMYSSCGMTQDLQQVFDETTVRDTVSWNSVIQGLGQNGLGNQALLVAERALELKMYNGNTFIAILTSCSHAGLVVEGLGYFDSMTEKYGVERTLDHYINVIDLLGRAGRLEEAHVLLQNMPFAPTVSAWSTLLHSCLAHKESLVGSIAARELKALQPDGSENYERLVLSCREGGTESSFDVAGAVKSVAHVPGCSWVT